MLGAFGVAMLNAQENDFPEVQVPQLKDLAADGELAARTRRPILVMFGASHCGYCSIVEEEFLKPMLISGEYDDKVIIRMIDIDGFDSVRDFQGREIDAADFASRENVYVTPTLKFYDSEGREMAPRMVGVTTVDFYGGYLDDSIDQSLARIRGRAALDTADSNAL